ncbi:hypothetical protein HMPREF0497_0432 [Lentilactobacillus buchneri ATCC 11577]|nr:hypothetical protein HMPREF0497_0432 [Lentilactobacillus buchneri ATCC 11577]
MDNTVTIGRQLRRLKKRMVIPQRLVIMGMQLSIQVIITPQMVLKRQIGPLQLLKPIIKTMVGEQDHLLLTLPIVQFHIIVA